MKRQFFKSSTCHSLSKRQNKWKIFSNFVAFSQYLNFIKISMIYLVDSFSRGKQLDDLGGDFLKPH